MDQNMTVPPEILGLYFYRAAHPVLGPDADFDDASCRPDPDFDRETLGLCRPGLRSKTARLAHDCGPVDLLFYAYGPDDSSIALVALMRVQRSFPDHQLAGDSFSTALPHNLMLPGNPCLLGTVSLVAHPAVPAVYDVGRLTDGTPYIIMEFIEGQALSIDAFATSTQPPAWSAVVSTLFRIAEALTQLHSRGFVHCDLKPQNIIVQRQDVNGTCHFCPKTIDFGLARNVCPHYRWNHLSRSALPLTWHRSRYWRHSQSQPKPTCTRLGQCCMSCFLVACRSVATLGRS